MLDLQTAAGPTVKLNEQTDWFKSSIQVWPVNHEACHVGIVCCYNSLMCFSTWICLVLCWTSWCGWHWCGRKRFESINLLLQTAQHGRDTWPLSSADLDPLQTGSSHLLERIPALQLRNLGSAANMNHKFTTFTLWFSPGPFLTSPYWRPISYEGVLRHTSSQSQEHPAPGGWNGLFPQNPEEASAPPSSYQPLLSAKSTTIFKWFLLPY